MNRERYLQNETTLRHQDKAGSLLPFSAGTTLIRNQRVFPIKAQLKMLRLIFLPFIFLFSCDQNPEVKKHIRNEMIDNNISVETIDSCEYILYASYYGASICHKENCKNHSPKINKP